MTWKDRDSMPSFIRRQRDWWMSRAERTEDPAVRDESEAEAMQFDHLAEIWPATPQHRSAA